MYVKMMVLIKLNLLVMLKKKWGHNIKTKFTVKSKLINLKFRAHLISLLHFFSLGEYHPDRWRTKLTVSNSWSTTNDRKTSRWISRGPGTTQWSTFRHRIFKKCSINCSFVLVLFFYCSHLKERLSQKIWENFNWNIKLEFLINIQSVRWTCLWVCQ